MFSSNLLARSFLVWLVLLQGGLALAANAALVVRADASSREKLAASEVRRYVYLRTGELLDTREAVPESGDAIVVGKVHPAAAKIAEGLKPDEYQLKTLDDNGRKLLVVVGGSDLGTLYGAYRLAEHLGVRFYMEGDVIPDERIRFVLPDLDEKGSPLFELRGIQPFHDFPEGPDWWDVDNYKAILSQLPKMRMNFFGLHTYPDGNVGPEPVVWVGRPEDVDADGRVKESYPSRHFSSVSGTWGSQPKKTSQYLFGAANLFDRDDYSQDVQAGMNPWPATPEACNEFFNRFGDKLRSAFEHARSLGIKTCIGTETPLVPPTVVRQRVNPGDPGVKPLGGSVVTYNNPIEGTDDDPLYQSVRYNLNGYRLYLPNGSYQVTLKFCELVYEAPRKRVFGVKLQGHLLVEELDLFAFAGKNQSFDLVFAPEVTDGVLHIEFTRKIEYPCLAAIAVEGPKTVKINCGASEPYKDYQADSGEQALDAGQIEQLYTGMFQRIMRTHPLDYYWFWTPESWTWHGVPEDVIQKTMADLKIAAAAAEKVQAPFQLATCGWVLGPPSNRALFDQDLPKSMAVSCINRAVGHHPVEPAFAGIEGRGKWAIPWLEDDPAMISPQLWAGRMRKDAADAKAYGCTGLMGIHWRTRVLGPNVSALAQAAWDQSNWPKAPTRIAGAEGGKAEVFADQAIEGTEEDPVYQSQQTGLKSYRIPAANGTRAVVLKFCELVHSEKGKRVFTVKMQGKPVLENLDIFAEAGRGKALDKRIEGVEVTDGWLVIEFVAVAGEPCLAGVQDNGPYGANAYNCGGPAFKNYAADLEPKPITGRYLPVADFYEDWARACFGAEVAEKAGELFARLDGNLPRPSNWIDGPGGIFPDARPWEQVAAEYAFVEEMKSLRPMVKGAGNLERFDYWLNTFRYLRANARVDCLLARQKKILDEWSKQPDEEKIRAFAKEQVLPIRIEVVKAVKEVYDHLLATVTNPSELGTIANWEQHSLPGLIDGPGRQLSNLFGDALPPEAVPSKEYAGPTRLIVPAARTSGRRGESFKLKIIVLADQPRQPALYYRPLGKGEFQKLAATNRDRGVYEVIFPLSGLTEDIEYYVEVPGENGPVRFPATAPQMNQTVVAVGE